MSNTNKIFNTLQRQNSKTGCKGHNSMCAVLESHRSTIKTMQAETCEYYDVQIREQDTLAKAPEKTCDVIKNFFISNQTEDMSALDSSWSVMWRFCIPFLNLSSSVRIRIIYLGF